MPPRSGSRAPSYAVGPEWQEEGFRQTGWVLLPLRAFLGVTFVVAGLQKIANPAYFDAHNPISFAATMRSLQHTSPIGPLLALSEHAPGLVGLVIAVAELAVGTGVLLGLWMRLAAIGGLLLSLTFFLTVSWNTAPYYYGSDIVFVFAWMPFVAVGAAGVLSVDAFVVWRTRPARGSAEAHRPAPGLQADLDRRRLVMGMRAAGLAALAAGTLAGVTAIIGRLAGGTDRATGEVTPVQAKSPSGTTSTKRHPRHTRAVGTPIGSASSVPVGQAALFHDPSSGQPAYVVHEAGGRFAAFSAVCTHAGCTIGFDASAQEFVCPCHGGAYSARTGQVVAGPPPAPLPAIKVVVSNGEIRVV